jgi:hypothetical protein
MATDQGHTSDGDGAEESNGRFKVQELEYARLCHERDRLREARGRFALGLGPAPASAGIATAIAAATAHRPDHALLWIATGLLGVLVAVGMVYDGKPAYRHLRARSDDQRLASPLCELRRRLSAWWKRREPRLLRAQRSAEATPPEPEPEPEREPTPVLAESAEAWYEHELDVERAVIGDLDPDNHWRPPWSRVSTLQEGLDSERTGARLIGLLWVAVIGLLLAAVLS